MASNNKVSRIQTLKAVNYPQYALEVSGTYIHPLKFILHTQVEPSHFCLAYQKRNEKLLYLSHDWGFEKTKTLA